MKDPDELPEEDRTVPSNPIGGDGGEDATIPSQPVDPPEDATIPSKPVDELDVDATKASGTAGAGTAGSSTGKGDKTVKVDKQEANAGPGGDLIGVTIGGCRVDSLLGRGAMGAVYKARQLKLDRDVAVKVIRPEMMTDPRMLKRFEVEARTVGKFNSAHVVMVHDVGFEQGVHYLVMEFVQGKNLREHGKMLAGGRLPAGEALPLIEQACKGLEEARRLGVVHRDIKPDNLMLTSQGVLKIADFGIAKPVQDDFSMTLTSELIGTPLYMSPEQCQGGADIDFRSDMYSLGATFFYLLTGEPPIRASSVYELIQTKTKMENLCLWKALPELDENNPLSRVIERMTANDREDRYESYEELLNDLVLVKHGETITIKPKRKKKPVPDIDDDGGKKGGLLAVLLTLLVLGGGGGAWWYFNQPTDPGGNGGGGNNPSGGGNGPVNTGMDRAAALEKIDLFRGRLKNNGPGGSLRSEAAGLAVPEDLVAQRDRLVADIEAGQAIEQSLRAIDKPTALELPFDDLKQLYAAIAAAAKLESAAGSEVREWMQGAITAARDEQAIGALARAKLFEAFTSWDADRAKAGTDKAKLAALQDRLDVIDDGWQALLGELPGERDNLKDLRERIDEGRRKLKEPDQATVVVDVSDTLDKVRKNFEANGPDSTDRRTLEELSNMSGEQLEQRNALYGAINKAIDILDDAGDVALRGGVPVAPFENITIFWSELDAELAQLGDPLPAWAQAEREKLRNVDSLQSQTVDACKKLWQDWRDERAGSAVSKEKVQKLEQLKGELENAVKEAGRLFPNAVEQLAQAVPQDALDRQMEEVRADEAARIWREDLRKVIRDVNLVRSIANWDENGQRINADLNGLASRLTGELGEYRDYDTLFGELRQVNKPVKEWDDAKQALGEIVKSFQKGELSTCKSKIEAAAAVYKKAELFPELRKIEDKCRRAFARLEQDLLFEDARSALDVARQIAVDVDAPAAIEGQIRSWMDQLKSAGEDAKSMVKIEAGRVAPNGPKVDAFFMSGTECSKGQFAQFVTDLQAAAGQGTDEERFQKVEQRLAGSGMTPRRLGDLLNKPTRVPDRERNLPMTRVSWYEAAAFAAFYGWQLPTLEQWKLAAFGEYRASGMKKFPWGDAWPPGVSDCNDGDRAMPVDKDGLSWRSSQLHHLGGNVGEWLASDPATDDADVAGGRYSKRRGLRDAAGGRPENMQKRDTSVRDVGFRVVQRPKSWPR